MKTIKNNNGKTTTLKFFGLKVQFSTLYNYFTESRKSFMIQFNRFENGNCDLYIRLFKNHFVYITGIKLKPGKRYFFGNKENN